MSTFYGPVHKFWEHMVAKYPDLEHGESASQTGRDHIPPRIFKEMTHLNKQRQKLKELLTGIGPEQASSAMPGQI